MAVALTIAETASEILLPVVPLVRVPVVDPSMPVGSCHPTRPFCV